MRLKFDRNWITRILKSSRQYATILLQEQRAEVIISNMHLEWIALKIKIVESTRRIHRYQRISNTKKLSFLHDQQQSKRPGR